MGSEAAIKDMVLSDVWKFAQPWLIPSIVTMLVTYGAIRFIEKLMPSKVKLPREIKAAIPILICILFQFAGNPFNDFVAFLILLGKGFCHGAVISSFYELFVWRVKKKIHGE